jgi:membrane-associated protease RseP (regulator of RpoE activity)
VTESLLYLLGIAFFVLVLAASIAIHELGHLIPAKLFGVRVKQYMIGFGPTVFSRRRGETEYGLKAIPLGGYITMVGMYPPERKPGRGRFGRWISEARNQHLSELEPGDSGREFYNLSVTKKLVIMLGGPFMNFVLGMVLVAVALTGIGSLQLAPAVAKVFECVEPSGPNGECQVDDQISPAAQAGLQAGDLILSVNGSPISEWHQVADAFAARPGETGRVTVQRGSETAVLVVTPIFIERQVFDSNGRPVNDAVGLPVTELRPFFGVQLQTELAPLPLGESLAVGLDSTASVIELVLRLPAAMGQIALSTFGLAERDPFGPLSIVGVGQIAGQVASSENVGIESRIATGLLIAGSLNFALFVFNLIPLLPLDGGHVAGAVYEGAKRRGAKLLGRADPGPVDTAKALPIAYTVWLLLIAVGLLLILADIVNPIAIFG